LAYKRAPKNPRSKRSPLWNKETLKEDLSRGKATLTSICKRYAEDESKWRALYNDVRRWAEEDDELRELLESNRKNTDSKKRSTVKGGRPKKENASNADWRVKFCEKLLETKSRVEASTVTPYSPDEIYQMLNEGYTSYDPKFAEMVHFVEMRFVAWAEEEMWLSLADAQHPKDRAWIAKEILKVRDRNRWGDKLDVSVKATHVHTLIGRGDMLALEGERREFFKRHLDQPALPPADIVEAEVVE